METQIERERQREGSTLPPQAGKTDSGATLSQPPACTRALSGKGRTLRCALISSQSAGGRIATTKRRAMTRPKGLRLKLSAEWVPSSEQKRAPAEVSSGVPKQHRTKNPSSASRGSENEGSRGNISQGWLVFCLHRCVNADRTGTAAATSRANAVSHSSH